MATMQPDINYAIDVDQSFHERPPVNLFDWENIVYTNAVQHQQPDLSTESSGPWTSPEFQDLLNRRRRCGHGAERKNLT